MNVTVPTLNPDIPSELNTAIEDARNRVSELEAESRRLARLCESIQQEIDQKVKDRVFEEELLAKFSTEKKEAEVALKESKDSLAKLKEESEKIHIDLCERELEVANRESRLREEERNLEAKKDSVRKKEESLSERQVKLEAREVEFDSRVARIEQALK